MSYSRINIIYRNPFVLATESGYESRNLNQTGEGHLGILPPAITKDNTNGNEQYRTGIDRRWL